MCERLVCRLRIALMLGEAAGGVEARTGAERRDRPLDPLVDREGRDAEFLRDLLGIVMREHKAEHFALRFRQVLDLRQRHDAIIAPFWMRATRGRAVDGESNALRSVAGNESGD